MDVGSSEHVAKLCPHVQRWCERKRGNVAARVKENAVVSLKVAQLRWRVMRSPHPPLVVAICVILVTPSLSSAYGYAQNTPLRLEGSVVIPSTWVFPPYFREGWRVVVPKRNPR